MSNTSVHAHQPAKAYLWCLQVPPDLPALDLVMSCCKEVDEVDGLEARGDDLGQRTGGTLLLVPLLLLIFWQLMGLVLKHTTEGDDGVTTMALGETAAMVHSIRCFSNHSISCSFCNVLRCQAYDTYAMPCHGMS